MAKIVGSDYSPTPSTRTFGNLKAEVAGAVMGEDHEEVRAVAGRGINAGIRWCNSRKWNQLVRRQDVTLVLDDADYSITADYKDSFHLECLDSSSNGARALEWQDPKSFFERFPIRDASGTPTHATVPQQNQDGLLILSKPPDAAFIAKYPTLRHWFFHRLNTLTDDGESLAAPSEFEGVLSAHGEWFVARRFAPEEARNAWVNLRDLREQLIQDDHEFGFRNWSTVT
jgi:hypothetical protein